MNIISTDTLQKLFDSRDEFCISIYMPTEKASRETRKNPIRFKNLVSEAESKLVEVGLSIEATEKLLKDAKKKIDDYNFWQNQQEGLACFISENETNYYPLLEDFPQLVVLGDRFYLKPLLPLISEDSKFYLLALSQNQLRLFVGTKYTIQELTLPEEIPASLAEATRYNDPEEQIQFHSVKRGQSPIYHGQGVKTTDNKDEILDYFQQIDRGLTPLLAKEQVDLILAGVDFLLPIYQKANSYSRTLPNGIEGNPENSTPEELHQQAWPIIQQKIQNAKQEAIAQYSESLTAQKASANLEQITFAAYHGQVDTLFVAANTQIWGKFDSETNATRVDQLSLEDNFDLLDFAAIHTFLQAGTVYILPQEHIPESSAIAAIFRYPIYLEANQLAI